MLDVPDPSTTIETTATAIPPESFMEILRPDSLKGVSRTLGDLPDRSREHCTAVTGTKSDGPRFAISGKSGQAFDAGERSRMTY